MKSEIRVISFGLILLTVLVISCKTKPLDYITYYNNVNEIDSAFRFQKDTLSTIKKYRKLFRKYPPKNQERINEFETFIKVADSKNKKFGGQKNLYKLIPLVAPNWKNKREEKDFLKFYKKHGIDSLQLESEVLNWKKGLNKKLIDSFSVAFIRDQAYRGNNYNEYLFKLNDKKNAALLKWTIENYGYPSLQKMGLWGNSEVFMPMDNLLLHLSDDDVYFPYLKEILLQYVKSGDCPPHGYAGMIDRHNLNNNLTPTYAEYQAHGDIKDSVKVDAARKSIGLPSLIHRRQINKDFQKSMK